MEKVYDGVTAVVEMIDPDRAREYKAVMLRNRTLREKDVRRYAEDMTTCMACSGQMTDGTCENCGGTASRWKLTGEPWIFDWFGRLIEGGHRAEAIIRSGAVVQTMVVRGVDPAVRSAINDGVKRKFSDDLVMAGQGEATTSAGLMRKIMYWLQSAARNEGRGGLAGIAKFSVSRSAMNEAWQAYEKEIGKAIRDAYKWKLLWPGNTGAMFFMYWLLSSEGNNPEVVERFFSIIVSGSQDPADRPLIQCRRLISPEGINRYRQERGEYGVEYEVYWLIRAWNGWLKGERQTKFALGKGGLADPYPKPYRAR